MSGGHTVSRLFVPGGWPGSARLCGPLRGGEVICDLKDAVRETGKRDARRHISWWRSPAAAAGRVNAARLGTADQVRS